MITLEEGTRIWLSEADGTTIVTEADHSVIFNIFNESEIEAIGSVRIYYRYKFSKPQKYRGKMIVLYTWYKD